ncbi:hypothetical protein OIU79_023495 [Salix purpurea]|uniref:Uncharacterized GPI-anchored protein At5g19230-like domain-containing protein n=1 Tax=Salix purpurea TaxID=77065 RepID=A0A9Q1A8Z0_SALPP|nr:hypothetical protein OIU79_023495 [Salix purpurea]
MDELFRQVKNSILKKLIQKKVHCHFYFVSSSGESFYVLGFTRVSWHCCRKWPLSKLKYSFPFCFSMPCSCFSSATVMRCGGGEDNLLENINSYRTSLLGLPALTKNKKASCLAREIADTLWNPCTTDDGPAEFVQLDDYPTELKHCYGDSSHTTDFAILPICIPGNDEQTPVNFQNYSRSQYEKYANESSYSGAGVGAGENWMVIVFVENNKSWSSAGGGKHSLVSGFGFGHGLVSLLLGLLPSYHLVCMTSF